MSPLLRAWKPLLCCGFATGFSWTVAAQSLSPQGGEYDLSGPLLGVQIFPSVSVGSTGGFLVWQDNRIDTNGFGIGALRLDSSLAAVGNKFRVNSAQVGDQINPQVALLTNGGAIVVWHRERKAANDIVARFLRADGTFLTGDVPVNPATSNVTTIITTNFPGVKANLAQNVRFTYAIRDRRHRERSDSPVVAVLADGTSVVAYSGTRRVLSRSQEIVTRVSRIAGRDYSNSALQPVTKYNDYMRDVFFQRFSAAGQKLGQEVLVNQFATYHQRNPAIAVLSNGNFVVTYVSELVVAQNEAQRDDVAILGRIFDPAGRPVGGEFRITSRSNFVASPVVGALADGRFLVAWSQRASFRTNGWDIYARVLAADGASSGDAFPVNTYNRGDQKLPRIAALGANQLVVWTSIGQDGYQEGVFGRFLSGGAPVGDEIAVNTTTQSKQIHPTVASDGEDRFLAVWSNYAGVSAYDLMGQQFISTQPVSSGSDLQIANMQASEIKAGTPDLVYPPTPPVPGIDPASVSQNATGGSSFRVNLLFDEKGQRLYWNAEAGATYQVQASTNLVAWTNLGPARVAAEANESIVVNVNGSATFYRLIRVR